MQSFLVTQGLFSLLPLLLFASFAFGTIALAAVSALFFSLFWISIAALVLGSTLFVTSSLALLAWVWVVGTYLAATFAYGLVFSGTSQVENKKKSDDEQQRLLSEKWEKIVKPEPGLVSNGTTATSDEADEVNEKGDTGGNEAAQDDL